MVAPVPHAYSVDLTTLAMALTGMLKTVNATLGSAHGRTYLVFDAHHRILSTTHDFKKATTIKTLATECFDKILSPLCPSSELSEKLYHEIIVYAEHMVTAEESKALRKEALHSTQVADSVRKRISLTEQVSQPAGTITSPSHAVITAA